MRPHLFSPPQKCDRVATQTKSYMRSSCHFNEQWLFNFRPRLSPEQRPNNPLLNVVKMRAG